MGVSKSIVDSLSFRDLHNLIKKIHVRREEDLKSQALLSYTNASLVVIGIAGAFADKETKFPDIHEVFPSLFKHEEKQEKQEDWKIIKAKMNQIAQRMKGGNSNDT